MIAYVDSSVVLRLVLHQSDRLRSWPEVDVAVASSLVEVECLRTFDRLRLRAALSDEDLAARRESLHNLLRRFEMLEPTRPVLQRAALPLPTALGTLDAIHLATALLWREREERDLTMATHDGALATAARAFGLEVAGA